MEMIIVTFFLVVLIVFLLYKYLTWHFGVWKRLGLPGPEPKIFFGNLPSFVTKKQHFVYDVDDVYNQYKKSHRAIGVFITRNPEIMILDPNLAHEIFVTNFRKFRDNRSSQWITSTHADKYASRNPFFVTGDDWKSKRADAIGGLTANKLTLANPIWRSTAQKMAEYLKEKTINGNAVIETRDLGRRFMICNCSDFLWGVDDGAFKQEDNPSTILKMAIKMLHQSFVSLGVFYKCNNFLFLRRFFDYRFYSDVTDNFFSQLTKDAIAMRLMNTSQAERCDYLNYILQLQGKKNLSHDDIVGNMLTVLLDGYETSGVVAFHTLYYLAKYPAVQENLRKEILSNLEADDYPTLENLISMPYLEQCIHETIRIISPIPEMGRICTEPAELELDNGKRISLSVGTVVVAPVFSYHHDPEYFPQPFEYKPERFDNGAHVEFTKQGIFLPFGDGPRICLGMRMGLLEVKTFLVEILKTYRVKSCAQTFAEKKPDSKNFIFGLDGDIFLDYERL